MNGPRSAPHNKQVTSDAGNAFPRRQPNLSLPCIPSDVDHWFAAELDKRGINQIIYGPTIISLLTQQRQASMPVAEQYNARVRAIEILIKASNGGHSTDDISRLVDEVDHRLRHCERSQDFPRPGPTSLGASPAFNSNHNLPAAVAAAAIGHDEGFLDWGTSPKALPAPVGADRAEEEGELLLNEVSDMLQQFNMEVRHGVDIEKPPEPSPPTETAQAGEVGATLAAAATAATAAPVVGIPGVNGRKRDASIDSGVGSFNLSASRDCSNESSPPSALDWLSVSPGSSIWSATSPAPNTPFNGGNYDSLGTHTAPLSADTLSAWSYQHAGQHQFRRMRFTSAPTYGDEEYPDLSRHRVLSTSAAGPTSGKKKKNSGGGKSAAGAKHHLHHGRQASPPSDSGSTASTSSGGSSPPAVGASVAPSSPSAAGAGAKSSLEKSRRACSFYLRGHCKKEDCEFAHDLTKVTCKFWMTGECFKGETCPFLHGQLNS